MSFTAHPLYTRNFLLSYFAQHALLSENNAKTTKGENYGYKTLILYLEPADGAGTPTVCASSSKVCRKKCIKHTGKMGLPSSEDARIRRTWYWFLCREEFIAQLAREIAVHVQYCLANGLSPAVRLNGTSDIQWEYFIADLMAKYPTCQWYDYTRHVKRYWKPRPQNYHLTYSYNEQPNSKETALAVLRDGGNVAVVFIDKHFPETFLGYPCVDGDAHDLTFTQPAGTVIALYAKGPAKIGNNKFIVRKYARVSR